MIQNLIAEQESCIWLQVPHTWFKVTVIAELQIRDL